MSHVYSIPVDDLIEAAVTNQQPAEGDELLVLETDVVIVGSGYGASAAATQLAGLHHAGEDRDLSVFVLERGREYSVGEFPNTLGELPGYVRFRRPSDPQPTGNADALFDLRVGADTDVLLGNGLGGGSLINANVAARPDPAIFDERWPNKYRNGGLDAAFDDIERLLGVAESDQASAKFEALKKVSKKALNQQAVRANIAVTQVAPPPADAWPDGRPPGGTGMPQPPCTRCGNCVTGCNVGAKNTLMMNLIPLAAERGAQFVTGANVLTVERQSDSAAHRWRLRLQRTQSIRTPLEDEYVFVDADYVILAAGALGSTEILQRSRDMADGVAVSSQLGRRFSTNGDGIGFGVGQKTAVNAIGTSDIHGGVGPGPTIEGIAQGSVERNGVNHPFTLEDAAIPAALVKLFGELTTTGAQLGRIGNNKLPKWFASQSDRYDPLAYNPDILPHNQTLLMMSDDGAVRSLALSPADNGAGLGALMRRQTLVGALAGAAQDTARAGLEALDGKLSKKSRKKAFDGGQYVANPLWRLLPEGASSALGGALPGGRSLTVHPLGGCAMGDAARTGVVNEDCQVFAADGGLVDGLYVMDGAVLPTALATNPLLTIAAVAWEASAALAAGPLAADGWQAPERAWAIGAPGDGWLKHHPGEPAPATPGLILREQMIGRITSEDPQLRAVLDGMMPGGSRLLERDGMVLRFTLDPVDVHGDFASLATDPVEVRGRIELFLQPDPASLLEKTRPYGAPNMTDRDPVAGGDAWVTLLQLDAPKNKRVKRALRALRAYFKRRVVSLSGGSGNLFAKLAGFLKVAAMHADYRQFRYRVEVRTSNGARIEFTGRKKLRWEKGEARVWDALLNLPVKRMKLIESGGQEHEVTARLRVDAGYMLDEGLIQVAAGSHDMIESVVATLSFVAWFARCLLHTCFWEFGSPSYPKQALAAAPPPPSLTVTGSAPVAPQIVPLAGDPAPLELVRYAQSGPAEPVLLVHGLAQGSGIFNTRHIEHNMARFFWEHGYDVWLVDYRLSNRLNTALDGFAFDAIGTVDIPAAVARVYADSGQQPVKVFAHCVGAVGMQIALLQGALKTAGGADMVESLCFNAIHPWIEPSAANLVKLKLATFVRDWVSDDLLDPVLRPGDADDALRSLMDRLAFSLARIGEHTADTDERHGKEDQFDNGICDRMTLFYGRMWRHRNLAEGLHDHWHEIVGPAPAEVYQQLYYLIERRRLLDDDGENTHLTEENIRDHWVNIPTFFVHGDLSDVFNPHSATRSAVRLDKVLREAELALGASDFAPVRLRRYAGLGHMDPILAAGANQTVYPEIERFFSTAHAWHADKTQPVADFDPYHEDDDPTLEARSQPESGPIVRAAWVDSGTVMVRCWAEQYRYNTSKVIGVLYDAGGGVAASLPFRPAGVADWFQWFDLPGINPLLQRVVLVPPIQLPKGAVSILVVGPRTESTRAILQGLLAPLVEQLASFGGGVDESMLTALIQSTPDDDGLSAVDPGAMGWFERLERRAQDPHSSPPALRFLVGSCRYPGTPMEQRNADAVFAGMLARLNAQPPQLLFLVGDQIYADAYATVFQADSWREVYHRSYISAFTSGNFSSLMRSVPVHFAVDDHELVDDYSGTADPVAAPQRGGRRGPQQLTYGGIDPEQVQFAFDTARSYVSSARSEKAVGGALQPPQASLWYALDHPGEVDFPCFVLDTRFQRELRRAHLHRAGAEYPVMLRSEQHEQLKALLAWLDAADQNEPDQPKFVIAGQIIAPLADRVLKHPSLFRSEDGLFGYPATLRAIVRHIAEQEIRNVVFVGGDLHFSCAARIEIDVASRPTATVWQIVASGLYAPMRFANGQPRDYTWVRDQADWLTPELRYEPVDVAVRYRAEWLTTHPAHFCEVDVAAAAGTGWIINVRAFDEGGQQLGPAAAFDETANQLTVRFPDGPY